MIAVETATRIPIVAPHLSADERQQMILKFAPMVCQVVGRILVVLPQLIDRRTYWAMGQLV